MPLIRVQVSEPVEQEQQTSMMRGLSATVAREMGKPESYMMVLLETEIPMLMGQSAEPAALVEVRSVGTISPDQARSLSKAIGEILEQSVGIGAGRVYINFAGVSPAMWGYDGRTFG